MGVLLILGLVAVVSLLGYLWGLSRPTPPDRWAGYRAYSRRGPGED